MSPLQPNRQKQIAFTTDKNGRPAAYSWSMTLRRWFRVPLDKAKMALSTGAARQVAFTRTMGSMIREEEA